MRLSKDLRTIYVLAIISSVILILGWGVKESYDSSSYIHAWSSLSDGHIDVFRTPTYPIFLGICKTIFGETLFKYAAIIFQHIIFLISIYYFNQLVFEITKKSRLSFWITFFYALYPAIFSWNNCILTESFAFIGSVFLLYFTLKLHHEFSVRTTFLFLFWFVFMIFLRPSFLYFLPVYVVFWILCLCLKWSRNSIVGIICTLIVISFQLLYIHQVKQSYGVFTPSSVSVINQYYMTRQNGLIYVDGIENEALKEDIKRSIKINGLSTDEHWLLWDEVTGLIDKYSLKDVQQVISVSMKNNPLGVLKKAGGRAYKAASFPISYTFIAVFSTIFDMFGANISFLYMFLIIYAVILTYWMIKERRLACFSLLIYMLGTSNVITVVFGAQQEWSRLILPSMPLYFLMFGQLCNMIKVKSPLSIDFK